MGSSNVGPASVHTGTTTSSHRVCARLEYLLICITMCTSLLYTRCSHLLLVCAFLSTRAPGIFVTALGDYSSLKFTNQTGRQAVSQAVRRTRDSFPRGNAAMTASCTVISGSFGPSASSCQKCGPAKVTSWAAQGHFHSATTPALQLCTTCKPRRCLSLTLFFSAWIMVHGSIHGTDSLQLGKGKNRVESQFPTDTMPVTCSPRPISTVGTPGDGILFCYGRLLPCIRGL